MTELGQKNTSHDMLLKLIILLFLFLKIVVTQKTSLVIGVALM